MGLGLGSSRLSACCSAPWLLALYCLAATCSIVSATWLGVG